MKRISCCLEDHIHFKFSNRCKYHDFPQEVLLLRLVKLFNEKKIDNLLEITEAAKGEYDGD